MFCFIDTEEVVVNIQRVDNCGLLMICETNIESVYNPCIEIKIIKYLFLATNFQEYNNQHIVLKYISFLFLYPIRKPITY